LLTGFTHFVLLKISKIAFPADFHEQVRRFNPQARRDRGSQKRTGEALPCLVESFDSRLGFTRLGFEAWVRGKGEMT
jgi:hypothetical protein